MTSKELFDYLLQLRNECGGIAICLIISSNFKELMHNIKVEEDLKESEDFYFYGVYDNYRFFVYVDKTLINCMYFVGNNKTRKIINVT